MAKVLIALWLVNLLLLSRPMVKAIAERDRGTVMLRLSFASESIVASGAG
jgi:hypothetical protein